jgi:hypothetical protein
MVTNGSTGGVSNGNALGVEKEAEISVSTGKVLDHLPISRIEVSECPK